MPNLTYRGLTSCQNPFMLTCYAADPYHQSHRNHQHQARNHQDQARNHQAQAQSHQARSLRLRNHQARNHQDPARSHQAQGLRLRYHQARSHHPLHQYLYRHLIHPGHRHGVRRIHRTQARLKR